MTTIPPIKIKKAADGKRTSNIVSNPTSIKALVVHFRFFAVFQSIEPTRPGTTAPAPFKKRLNSSVSP